MRWDEGTEIGEREGWRKGQPKPAQDYKDYITKSKQHATCIKTQNVCLFKLCGVYVTQTDETEFLHPSYSQLIFDKDSVLASLMSA